MHTHTYVYIYIYIHPLVNPEFANWRMTHTLEVVDFPELGKHLPEGNHFQADMDNMS